MSLAIWAGLGVDFSSNTLVFKDAFHVDPQFLFVQTVVAILVINGALLSVRINDALIRSAERGEKEVQNRTVRRLIGVSGSVSFVSWATIYFADFFELTLSYPQMLAVYISAVVVVFLLHRTVHAAAARLTPSQPVLT